LSIYCIEVVDERLGALPYEFEGGVTVSRQQYTDFLRELSESEALSILLNQQQTSCGRCKSYSWPVLPFCNHLKNVTENLLADILCSNFIENTGFDSWYAELIDQPSEIVEKHLAGPDDYEEFQEVKRIINEREWDTQDGLIYTFPYAECVVVFTKDCTCGFSLRLRK
jgi:hypothetical protein